LIENFLREFSFIQIEGQAPTKIEKPFSTYLRMSFIFADFS